MTEKQRKYLIELLPLALICALTVMFILSSALEYGRNADQLQPLQGWTVDETAGDGRRVTLQMSALLPEQFADAQSLCFFSVYQQVCVRLDDVEVFRFDVPPGEKLLEAAPSNWNSMALPE